MRGGRRSKPLKFQSHKKCSWSFFSPKERWDFCVFSLRPCWWSSDYSSNIEEHDEGTEEATGITDTACCCHQLTLSICICVCVTCLQLPFPNAMKGQKAISQSAALLGKGVWFHRLYTVRITERDLELIIESTESGTHLIEEPRPVLLRQNLMFIEIYTLLCLAFWAAQGSASSKPILMLSIWINTGPVYPYEW